MYSSLAYYANTLYSYAIKYPLKKLYYYGPSALGMWQGKTQVSICSVLSSNPSGSIFWQSSAFNREECENIINAHFQSYLVVADSLLYIFLLWRIYRILEYICLLPCRTPSTTKT